MRYASSASARIWIWLFAVLRRASPTLPKSDGATTAASVAIIAMTTSSSINVNPRRAVRALVLDDTKHLFDGCESCLRLLPAVGAQWHEAALDGDSTELTA